MEYLSSILPVLSARVASTIDEYVDEHRRSFFFS